jgi:PAS domain S-box-containing protein
MVKNNNNIAESPKSIRKNNSIKLSLKNTKEILKERETQYRLLADHMKDALWLMDMDLRWQYISPSTEKILGYTVNEIKQMPLDKILTPASYQKAMDFYSTNLSKIRSSPRSYSVGNLLEIECCCKDGHTIWVEIMFSFLRDEKGEPSSILGEGRDITERKRIEEKLHFESKKFQNFVDHSLDILVLQNLEGIVTYINPTVEKVLGYKPEERIGRSGLELVHPDDVNSLVEAFLPLYINPNTPPVHLEYRLRHKNGTYRTVESVGSNLVKDNVIESVINNYRDITRRKQVEEELKQTLENLRKSYNVAIQILASAIEIKDPYTAGHQTKSADIAEAIALEMELANDKIEGVRMAASIHDIGKLSVPAEILSKPIKLTDIEFSLIKEHSRNGYDMLKGVESPWPLAKIVHQHHERINGTGYPGKLKGNDIIIEARILAVADVVEAMASHRPYRASLGIDVALEEIEKNKGILYDENVVDACLRLFREKGYQLK